jgi:hypothetical protein
VRRRALIVGFAASLLGCATIVGLNQYELSTESDVDAGLDSASSPIDGALAHGDASSPVDAGHDSGSVDATIDAPPPCAACPAGTARRLCIADACSATRRVFVTAAGFAATFGSAANADSICQDTATTAKLGGSWKAWISTNAGDHAGSVTSSPQSRFIGSADPYRLLDGTPIALSSSVLFGGSTDAGLPHPIDRNEQNQPLDTSITGEVWTGTETNGTPSQKNCYSWTSSAPGDEGLVGVYDGVGWAWSGIYYQQCSRNAQHLYCFEQ